MMKSRCNLCIVLLSLAVISSIQPGPMVVDIAKNFWVNGARSYPDKKLYIASKIPPKNFKWPAEPKYSLDDCYPPDHIRQYVESSLKNLGLSQMDLIQFHTWDDSWAEDARWQRALGRS